MAQELQSKCQALEETCDTIHVQVFWARQEGELERLQAVESKCAKWEVRKVRLVAQLQAAEERVGRPSFPRYSGSTIRIDSGSAHPKVIISSHNLVTNGASSPREPKQRSSPRKPKQCSSPRKPKQWREWYE